MTRHARPEQPAGCVSGNDPGGYTPQAETPSYGLPERLAEVEALILDFRWARNSPQVPEHATYCVLKLIAADLRGRFPGTASAVLRALEAKIVRADAAKTSLGYDAGHLRAIAETLIGRWPVVRLALAKFAEDITE